MYSFWLAGLGHEVHLIDCVPLHIEQARRTESEHGSPRLAGMHVGDARHLSFDNSTADIVILHGPLYHLVDPADRLLALREACRMLRPGGLLLAFAISNYASSIVGITRGWVWDPDYLAMCEGEVATGDHVRPANWPSLFSTGYFHHPHVLGTELEAGGFACEDVLGIQGPGWIAPDFAESWSDPTRRDAILRIARMVEREPSLSPHMMAVGRRRE
jgi:SAM-dependent methyltransferase